MMGVLSRPRPGSGSPLRPTGSASNPTRQHEPNRLPAPHTEARTEPTRLLLEPIHSREELYDHYDRIDRVENNRLLDSGQALALRSEARTPILTAILAELDAGEWTPQQLENTREEIEDLYQRRRITRDQAGHLESRFAAAAGDTPVTPPQRARRLDVLAELRGSGALSEEEFQIERERTLKQPAAPS